MENQVPKFERVVSIVTYFGTQIQTPLFLQLCGNGEKNIYSSTVLKYNRPFFSFTGVWSISNFLYFYFYSKSIHVRGKYCIYSTTFIKLELLLIIITKHTLTTSGQYHRHKYIHFVHFGQAFFLHFDTKYVSTFTQVSCDDCTFTVPVME